MKVTSWDRTFPAVCRKAARAINEVRVRGVDIASADNIQNRILDAAREGCAVLLISSDLDELIKVSDRIMVLFRGRIMGFVDADEATREGLGRMMLSEAH